MNTNKCSTAPPSVLLTLNVDPTGVVSTALNSASGKCPLCTDQERPGWLYKSGPNDHIEPEEDEDESFDRMCLGCQNNPSNPFCDGYCLRVSYEEFHKGGFQAICSHCYETMCGEEWAVTCDRCEDAFCKKCTTLLCEASQ